MPNGFVLAYIARRYSAIRIESFKKLVEEIVQSETKNEFTNIELYDTITVFKSISIGLDKTAFEEGLKVGIRLMMEVYSL